MTASQNEIWKVPETWAVTVAPWVQLDGSVTVEDPLMGRYRPKCPAATRTIIRPTAKAMTE